MDEDKQLPDGIYDVTGLNTWHIYHEFSEKMLIEEPDVKAFIEEYPDFVVGSAYQCGVTIFVEKKPPKWQGICVGSGFNYGSTNLLSHCPERILILAEDD